MWLSIHALYVQNWSSEIARIKPEKQGDPRDAAGQKHDAATITIKKPVTIHPDIVEAFQVVAAVVLELPSSYSSRHPCSSCKVLALLQLRVQKGSGKKILLVAAPHDQA